MSHRLLVVLFCLMLCSLTFAQESPRAEFFIGYSYLNASTNGLTSRQNVNGGEFSWVINVNSWIGAETDFGAYYKNAQAGNATLLFHDYSVLAGPRIWYKMIFAHAVFGLDTLSTNFGGITFSQGGFAGAAGGGARFLFSKHIGVEGSFDYAFSRHNLVVPNPITQNNFRAAGGVVFVFGKAGNGEPQVGRPISVNVPTANVPRSRTGIAVAAIGITGSDEASGVRVVSIAPGGLAEKAGLKVGDVINSVNGKRITDAVDLTNELSALLRVNATVRIGYLIRGSWQSEATINSQ